MVQQQFNQDVAVPASEEETRQPTLLESVTERTVAAPRKADGIAIGILDSLAQDGSPFVAIPSFGVAAAVARTLAPIDASRVGETVALGFESGDPMRPIILGFMMQQPVVQEAQRPPANDMEAVIDGERVVLSAEHEIELRCGEAALILSADGRIQLRGTYITSHASATQRILGGSVNVN